MHNQISATIEEHLFTYDARQPFAQRRPPGALLLYGHGICRHAKDRSGGFIVVWNHEEFRASAWHA